MLRRQQAHTASYVPCNATPSFSSHSHSILATLSTPESFTFIMGNHWSQPSPQGPNADMIPAAITNHAGTEDPGGVAERVIIDVGGRLFAAKKQRLYKSPFFKTFFMDMQPQVDAQIFHDADPDVSAHILRYMQDPRIYPLLWTKDRGFDYDMYNRIGFAAVAYQLDALRDWIRKKTHHQAITTHYEAAETMPYANLRAEV